MPPAPRSVDVGSAARSLIGKADVFYTSTDNNVVSAYEALVKVGMDAKIPLVAADTDSVVRGAVAAYGMDYKAIGVQTGQLVVRILKGEKPGAIASETSNKLDPACEPGRSAEAGRHAVRRPRQGRRQGHPVTSGQAGPACGRLVPARRGRSLTERPRRLLLQRYFPCPSTPCSGRSRSG